MAVDRAFLGRGWAFPVRFHSAERSVEMVSEDADIQQSLAILLATALGERLMLPGFGVALGTFMVVDENAKTELARHIEGAIVEFERRIKLREISIDAAHGSEGRIDIALSYDIPSINSRGNMVYPHYLEEGTLVRSF